MLGNCCIFRVVTDGRIRQNAFSFKLERRRKLQGTYIQDSRVSMGQEMQTQCPCFVWKGKSIISCHSWMKDPPSRRRRKKIRWGSFSSTCPSSLLSRKKALCGSECSWDGTRKTRICLEIIKKKMNYYIKQAFECTSCPWMHVNVWCLIIRNKRTYSHLYRGVSLISFLIKKAPPFPSFSLHTVLLASTYTCQSTQV